MAIPIYRVLPYPVIQNRGIKASTPRAIPISLVNQVELRYVLKLNMCTYICAGGVPHVREHVHMYIHMQVYM